jgi:hypothetical protein
MDRPLEKRLAQWGVGELQERYPGLRIKPSRNAGLLLAGEFAFHAAQGEFDVADSFEVEIHVPADFPQTPPIVREIGGRIPSTFHRYKDGTLCLGSPLRLKMEAWENPTLLDFVQAVLVPYFFNFLIGQRTGHLPLGELAHFNKGVLDDYRRLLGACTDEECRALLFLLTIRKRLANKRPCPCGSGQRVGTCHSRVLNRLRPVATRSWFRWELQQLIPP